MKILVVNPSLRLGSKTKFFPVGVAAVMTYLKHSGWHYDLLDIDIDDLTDQQVEKFISERTYDVVMAGSIVTHYKWMKWFTKMVRRHYPHSKIIIGNSVGSSIPELFLRNSEADVIVIGEGEITTVELLKAIHNKQSLESIDGIAYLKPDGSFVKTVRRKGLKKLDDFPMIDWDDFNCEKYFQRSYAGAEGLAFSDDFVPRVMPVTTARGCAFRCTFCHFVFWDDPYRYRSPENILSEIKRNIEKYKANYINFWDDLSFASLPQAERLADAIISSGLSFNWNAAVRVDLFGNPKFSYERRRAVAEKFVQAGCLNLGFSLESGNQDILEMMNKKVKSEYFYEQCKILKEVGITCSTSVVFGYPIETEESINETFQQCLQAGVYPSIGYLLPLPSTGMYEYAKEHGFITNDDKYLDSITERQDLCINMTNLSEQQIMSLIKDGAAKLNDLLQLGLTSETLIKTGGYRAHTKETSAGATSEKVPLELKRNQNDFSFNYSRVNFVNSNLSRSSRSLNDR